MQKIGIFMSNALNTRVERDGNALIFKRVEVAGRGFYDIRIEIKDGQTPTEAFEENIVRIRQLAAQVFQSCDPASSKIIYTASPETCSHSQAIANTREIWQNLFVQSPAQAGTRIAIPETPHFPTIPQPPVAPPPVAPAPLAATPAGLEPAITQPAAPAAAPVNASPDISTSSSTETEESEELTAVEPASVKQFEFDCLGIQGNETTEAADFFDEVVTAFKKQHREFNAKFPDCSYTSLGQANKSDPAFKAYCNFLKNPQSKGDKGVDLMRDLMRAFYKAALAKRRGTNRNEREVANEIIGFIPSNIDSKLVIKYLTTNS